MLTKALYSVWVEYTWMNAVTAAIGNKQTCSLIPIFFQARMKSSTILQQLEFISQTAKYTLASVNPETQPVSKGLLKGNSKMVLWGDIGSMFGVVQIPGGGSCVRHHRQCSAPITFSLFSEHEVSFQPDRTPDLLDWLHNGAQSWTQLFIAQMLASCSQKDLYFILTIKQSQCVTCYFLGAGGIETLLRFQKYTCVPQDLATSFLY